MDSVGLAWTSLKANKMRSALTLLGVIIGIASVVAILTLGDSLKKQSQDALADVGVNDLTVSVQERSKPGEEDADSSDIGFGYGSEIEDESSKISDDLVDNLRSQFGSRISGVGIGETLSTSGEVTNNFQSKNASLQAVNADYLRMKNIKVSAGQLFSQEDTAAERPVAIVNQPLVDKLFQGRTERALGAELEFQTDVGYSTFQIVGVEAVKKSNALMYEDDSARLLVPYTLAPSVMEHAESFTSVSVRVAGDDDSGSAGGAGGGSAAGGSAAGGGAGGGSADSGDSDATKRELEQWAKQAYSDNPDYELKVTDMSKDLADLNKVFNSLSLGLAAIAGLSLLVGGIGVMNIMLITVTERTREIGVRKALGATRSAIRWQFVIEAMIVCLVGGVIGVILGGIMGMSGARALGALVPPPVSGIALSLLFALGIGLFFGYYPANKAAKLNPIDALRYE